MTTRLRTISVPFDSRTTTLATATTHTFTTQTIYIPQTTSRTFTTAKIEITADDGQATAFSTTAITVGVTLGAAGASNQAFTNSPPANTGEHKSLILTRDVTSYFNTNFGSGGNQTCVLTYINTGGTTINISAKIILTFEFDDGDTTWIKTAYIPIESTTGALTATLAAIGSSQIPNLDSFLPESSKTYRHIWFEVRGNGYEVGTANDPTLDFRIDGGGTTHSTGAYFTDLASARGFVYIWNIGTGGFTTNATHDLQMRASTITTAATFNHLAIVLCVNYEYDESASSTILNSLIMAARSESMVAGATSSEYSRIELEFYVEEPTTITLVQSGIMCQYTQITTTTPQMKIGSATERGYTEANLAFCGQTAFMQRLDSGAAGGAGITLARGKNTLVIDNRNSAATNMPTGFNFTVYLNYTSGKATNGEGVHNKSIYEHINDQYDAAASTDRKISALSVISIPESEYFLNNVFIETKTMLTAGTANYHEASFEIGSGELQGDGWAHNGGIALATDQELGMWAFNEEITNKFERYPTDPSGAADIEASRRWKYTSMGSQYASMGLWTTYHSISYSTTRAITGSAGATVDVDVFDAVTGALVAETSRSGNGNFTFTAYDDVATYYAVGYEDATHRHVSEIFSVP